MIHHDVHTRTSCDEISGLTRRGVREDATRISDICYLKFSVTASFKKRGV